MQLQEIGGSQREPRRGRALKNGGGSLAVGSYLQRGCAPPLDFSILL